MMYNPLDYINSSTNCELYTQKFLSVRRKGVRSELNFVQRCPDIPFIAFFRLLCLCNCSL